MELIVIDKNKIKLMLTPEDMMSYKGKTGEVIREIISDAHRRLGLDGLYGRVFVQMYQSKEGGCELFVTGLDDKKTANPRTIHNGGSAEVRQTGSKERHVIYSFDGMDMLLSCCSGLTRAGYIGQSRAYLDRDKGQYYLELDRESAVAGENLGSLCPSRIYYYINEHCQVICPDSAAEKLGRFA